MAEKPRCQALLLMPRSRRHYDGSKNYRCQFNAKSDSNFCGVHNQLSEFIKEIVWLDSEA